MTGPLICLYCFSFVFLPFLHYSKETKKNRNQESLHERRRFIMLAERKIRRARVSKKRQITIPKDFFDALHISDETTLEYTGDAIVIRPAQRETVDFSVHILEDLTKQGYTGSELVMKFAEMKRGIPDALSQVAAEAIDLPVINDLDAYLDALDEEDAKS